MIRKKRVGCNISDLTPHERAACQVLENARRPLSTNEIARFSRMSWLTAKRHLESLERKRIGIHSVKKGKSINWYLK